MGEHADHRVRKLKEWSPLLLLDHGGLPQRRDCHTRREWRPRPEEWLNRRSITRLAPQATEDVSDRAASTPCMHTAWDESVVLWSSQDELLSTDLDWGNFLVSTLCTWLTACVSINFASLAC